MAKNFWVVESFATYLLMVQETYRKKWWWYFFFDILFVSSSSSSCLFSHILAWFHSIWFPEEISTAFLPSLSVLRLVCWCERKGKTWERTLTLSLSLFLSDANWNTHIHMATFVRLSQGSQTRVRREYLCGLRYPPNSKVNNLLEKLIFFWYSCGMQSHYSHNMARRIFYYVYWDPWFKWMCVCMYVCMGRWGSELCWGFVRNVFSLSSQYIKSDLYAKVWSAFQISLFRWNMKKKHFWRTK